jgi:hypothetical protein
MTTKQKPTHVQPKEAASFHFEGEDVVLRPTEVFAADDPMVREHPDLFKPLEPTRQRPAVEQMTAAPGERRGESAD